MKSKNKPVSPYMAEIVSAQSVQRLANLLGVLRVTDDGSFNIESPAMQNLLGDVAAVREEYNAAPDDIQRALLTHEPMLAAD